ncbi:hypothetical protein M3J07_002492 [Ascochyta lentis]
MSEDELAQPLLEGDTDHLRRSNSAERPFREDLVDIEPTKQPIGRHEAIVGIQKAFLMLSCSIAIFSFGIYVGRILTLDSSERTTFGDVTSFQTVPPLAPIQLRFRGTLAAYSPYKGPPTPVMDKSWDSITKDVYISVPEDRLAQAGFDTAVSVRDPLNKTQFIAELEYRHYLHCLKYIFRYTYFDYYEEWLLSREANSTTLRVHIDHCFDLLRQYIECKADSGFVPFAWVQDKQAPYPNFNIPHVCQDVNVVRRWELDFGRSSEIFTQASRIPGQEEMVMPP